MSKEDVSDPGASAAFDVAATKKALASSSTSVRIAQLHGIEDKATQKCTQPHGAVLRPPSQPADISHPALDSSVVPRILQLLFGTYVFYIDRESRLAVQRCLASLITADIDPKALAMFVGALRKESQKPGIAITSAFVLVEWCSLLMQNLAETSLWDEFATDILLADADALEKCLQSMSRKSVSHSALVVTRRGLRKLLLSADTSEKRLTHAVNALATKGPQPTARNAVLLGVIAGVSARKEHLRPVLESLKPKYYDFFQRELVGSRTIVPEHLALGLGDFFTSFTTLDEVSNEVIPGLEKGLLRAPEVTLGGVLTPLVRSLPESFDLSQILDQKILKSLLSNVKSTNPAIRAGALDAFYAMVSRCHDSNSMDRIIGEIATPLKSGKLTSPDHRVMHAQMLEGAPLSKSSADKVANATATVAGKEGNEGALVAETSALAKAVAFILHNDGEVPKAVLDIITKGLAEKKAPSRKAWLLRTGQILQTLADADLITPGMSAFVEAVIPKIIANFTEVIANTATAALNGLIVGAYILIAVSPFIRRSFSGSATQSALAQADVSKHSLIMEPKPSFLLNQRVYSKLTIEDDLRWFNKALIAIYDDVEQKGDGQVVVAWSEAVIHLIAAHGVPATIRQESSKALSKLYAENPKRISTFIVNGLWDNVKNADTRGPEHSSDSQDLVQVVKAIFLSSKDAEKYGHSLVQEELELQACSLLVLARPELIPRANWIDLCLRVEIDPGNLVRKYGHDLLKEVEDKTSRIQKVWLSK